MATAEFFKFAGILNAHFHSIIFHVLATVNNATMNLGMQISFSVSIVFYLSDLWLSEMKVGGRRNYRKVVKT